MCCVNLLSVDVPIYFWWRFRSKNCASGFVTAIFFHVFIEMNFCSQRSHLKILENKLDKSFLICTLTSDFESGRKVVLQISDCKPGKKDNLILQTHLLSGCRTIILQNEKKKSNVQNQFPATLKIMLRMQTKRLKALTITSFTF